MKQCKWIFVLLLISSLFLSAEKVAVLSELNNPDRLVVDGDYLYVADDLSCAVYIYSLKDNKLKVKLDKRGEGPQEFMIDPNGGGLRIYTTPTALLVNSIGKVSFFKKDGTYIKEIREENQIFFAVPIGNNFSTIGFARSEDGPYATVNLFDSNLKFIKEITRIKSSFKPGKMNPFLLPPFVYSSKEKLIVVDFKDSLIYIFNANGTPVTTIKHPFEKITVTAEHQQKTLAYFKNNPKHKNNFERIKQMIEFPQYLPDIHYCNVSDEKIYIQTYRYEKDKAEFFIFDLNGKLVKRIMLPVVDMNFLKAYPYTISAGKIYQLVENEGEEAWELHRIDIK